MRVNLKVRKLICKSSTEFSGWNWKNRHLLVHGGSPQPRHFPSRTSSPLYSVSSVEDIKSILFQQEYVEEKKSMIIILETRERDIFWL